MKTELSKIAGDLEQGTITETEARSLLLDLFIISDSILAEHGISIEYSDYGIWKLFRNGEYLGESSLIDCHQRAFEIIQLSEVLKTVTQKEI